jgi:UDP-glucose 4-epimerase
MNIWITGIAGFLGSYLADELKRLGHNIDGNDNLICASNPIGDYHVVDCREYVGMMERMKEHKTDVLIHCAATAHEGLSSFSPSFVTKNIYEASVATFSAAIAAGVKRIVYMSSMSRYGKQKVPFLEYKGTNPVDPYGIAKVAAEQTLKVLSKTHNTEYVIAVPHNIIGSRQRYWDPYRNVVSIMINRALQGKPIIVYGDGMQKRCFSPIKDCLHSLTRMINLPISGEIINIGPDSGELTILDLANKIIKITGSSSGIVHVASRPNEVKNAYCLSDKARDFLGYRPQQSLEDCLSEMVEYIKINGTRNFEYSFPIEIEKGCPKTWSKKLI